MTSQRGDPHTDLLGVVSSRSYDEWNNVLTEMVPNPSSVGPTQVSATYSWVGSGRMASATERLHTSGSASTATPLAATQAFDVAHQLCWTSPVASTNGCDTPPAGATTFGYDVSGNRTSMTPPTGPATTYGYDQANRLVTVTGPVTATYTYDGAGLRVAKTVDSVTTSFVWDTLNTMPVVLVEDDVYYLYGPDGLPLARIDDEGAGDPLYYHLDHQGSVRALTDEDGELVATYTYDPYGNPTGATGTIDQPLGYTGQYLDAETGLYQLRARYYDPRTGQFTTIDPMLADTSEPYTYAGNNPTNNWDPLGLFCIAGKNPNGSCRGSSTTSTVASAARSGWNATGGRVVTAVNNNCLQTWQQAATCTAVVAEGVALGAGGLAAIGVAGGLTGTAGSVATVSTLVGLSAQTVLTVDDCRRGVGVSCAANAASTIFGAGSAGLGLAAGRMALRGISLYAPTAAYSVSAGFFGFALGFPDLDSYLSRMKEC